MTTPERAPGAEIPRLRDYLSKLVGLAERTFARTLPFDSSNHLAFMALAFAGKQVVHARSILTLRGSMDTSLIARSMFEGLSQLLWAVQSPSDRPEKWRAFAFVRDWRQLRRDLAQGLVVPEDTKKHIERGIQQFGDSFLSPKARKARAAGQPLPDDPYSLNWYGEKEKEVFKAVDGQVVYDELYGPFSEWHHWRIGGFGPIVRFDESSGTFVFNLNGEVPSTTESALAGAFQCLLQTLATLDQLVSLEITTELTDMRQRYVSGLPAA